MNENPYSAPSAPLEVATSGQRLLYTPTQVAAGAFLGGPLSASYFLWANYWVLGNHAAARATPWLGGLATIVVIALAYALPEHSSSASLVIPQVVLARMAAERTQMSKAAIESSPEFAFQSGWKVFGVSLLWLLGTLVVLFGVVFLGMALGLVR
jgi:hypothetical protein